MTAGKKFKNALAKVDRTKRYTGRRGVHAPARDRSIAKFDETVDVAIHLGVDPKHADQMVRGAVVLPHGTGKTKRVLVFAKGDKANEAEAPAPTSSGAEDLVKKIQRRLDSTSTRSSPRPT